MSCTVRNRITNFSPLHNSTLLTERGSRRSGSTASQLSQVITVKLEDGNIKADIRILSSEEGPVTPSEQSFSSLKSKRPTASKPSDGFPNLSQYSSLLVTDSCGITQARQQMEESKSITPFCFFHLALLEVQTAHDLNTS